ncbi:hypothetical protein, partial [Elioraea sp.]|uniref:hypothetical protein n=1 Tax=Elioraea sp. TaxID=2185103 RepID=UPI003F705A3E
MIAAVMLAPRAQAPAGAPLGLVAAARIGRDVALLLGEHDARLPRLGVLTGAGSEAIGKLRLTAWPRATPGRAWFAAVAQFAEALPAAGAALTVQAHGVPDRALGQWPASLATAEALGAAIAARADGRAAELAVFLSDLAMAAPKSTALRSALRSFLAAAAEEDGVIEILGRTADALMLQGWGHAAEPQAEAILVEHAVLRTPIVTAAFQRPDIAAPASGLVQLLTLPAGVQIQGPGMVHVVTQGRLRRRKVLPTRTLLERGETAAHLRGMLPRLAAPPATLSAIKRAARPVYAGSETISRLGRPVATALDVVVALPGQGAYVMGWLLDPAGAVTSVALCDPPRFAARMDRRWTRVARPDVSAGFRADPRFAAVTGDLHGFAAFLPGALPEMAGALHLALELTDGEVAFLPAAPVAGPVRSLLRRAAATVDLFKPTGLAVVEAALAPLIGAAGGAVEPPETTVRRAPRPAPTALVLALPAPDGPPAAAFSCFLNDPPVRGEEALVVVLGPEWRGAPLAALEAAAAFYGLDPGIALADEDLEVTEAWEIGARAVQADRYLCLGGAGLAGPRGWRRALARGTPGDACGVAVPMLLYEDGSVRSLGFDAIEPSAAPPYLRVRRRAAGLPASSIGTETARPCLGAALAGAMVSAR